MYDTIILKHWAWGKIGLWAPKENKKVRPTIIPAYCLEAVSSHCKEGELIQSPAEITKLKRWISEIRETKIEFVQQSTNRRKLLWETTLKFCREFSNLWVLIFAFVRGNHRRLQWELLKRKHENSGAHRREMVCVLTSKCRKSSIIHRKSGRIIRKMLYYKELN